MSAFSIMDLFLFSDFESDDLLATWIILKNGYNLRYIVVGEGQYVEQKTNRVKNYFDTVFKNYERPVILSGEPSEKDFPEDFGFPDAHLNEITIQTALSHFVQNGGSKLVIMKPPREIFEMMYSAPEETKDLFQRVRCYLYGSFNMKSLDATDREFAQFVDLFGELYLYESFFATGPQNNLNPQNFPLIQKLKENSAYAELLQKWDDYVIRDCVDTCMELLKKYSLPLELVETSTLKDKMDEKDFNRYGWNYKCYVQVVPNAGSQTVLADMGMAVTIDRPQFYMKANIQFGSLRNTSITFDENGKHYVCVSDFDTIVSQINTVFEE